MNIVLQAITLALGAGALAAGPATAPAPPAALKRVIVVFKTHYDLGYTEPLEDILQYYRGRMIDDALDLCDATKAAPPGRQFAWSIQAWPLARMLDEQQTSARRERIMAALHDKTLTVLASPFTIHADALELEDIVRSLHFSSEIARAAGLELPRDAKVTDAPSAPWCLPTILARAGVQFLCVGVNRVCVPPETPLLFWWEGPDGSRLLTMLVDAYGTGQIPPRDIGGFGSGLVPPKNWPYATWLALIHTSDNEGPPKPQVFKDLMRQADEQLPGVSIRVGRMSDFADEILREQPSLPVVRADMPDAWIHGIMSMPVEAGVARNIRPQIATVDVLSTLLNAWGVAVPDSASKVAQAYEKSLLYGEHTWGTNVKRFGPRLYGEEWRAAHAKGQYDKLEASWAEHAACIQEAARIVNGELETRMKKLASAIKVDGQRIVVFNPLPWTRDALVEVKSINVFGGSSPTFRDATTGEYLPVDDLGVDLQFVARQVPALGYRTYAVHHGPVSEMVPIELQVDEKSAVFENRYLRVQLDPERGTIRSLVDKASGRELAGKVGDFELGQYVYERFSQDEVNRFLDQYTRFKSPVTFSDFGKPNLPPASQVPYRIASPRGFKLAWSKGHHSITATMTAAPGESVNHAVSLAVTLQAGQPHVDLAWSVQNKEPDSWPEAGWLCLPVNAAEPSFRLGRAGAIVDPVRDLVPASNHHVLCVNSGLTVTDGAGQGLGICPLDAPLVSLDEPGLWRFSRAYTPKRPIVWVNLYNNQWPTNFVQWIGGSWTSRVRLWAVSGSDSNANIVRPSWEARMPCLAAWTDGRAGTLPPSQAGITLSRSGVLVTALGANPDGPGILLRLWEQAGQDEPCRVRLPAGLVGSRVQPCDLRGRPTGEPLAVQGGEFELKLSPFAPATVLLSAPQP